MNLLDFEYTKADGKKSQRLIASFATESTNVSGIDLEELSTDERALFLKEYMELLEVQKEATNKLLAKHDLKHSYRMFKRSGMSDINVNKL